MVHQKPSEVADEAPIPQAAAPLQHNQPQQPFDYRKFFDFSFFGNMASAFGGSPHGFQGVQQQQQVQSKPQDHLISYTVQKQFAPVKYAPVEEPQKPQPATQPQEQTAVEAGGEVTTGFHKTVYISPFAPIVAKKHFHRRLHHPRRVHVVKTIEIQWITDTWSLLGRN